MSARKPCRHCLIEHSDLANKIKENQVTLRNPCDHSRHVSEVEGSGGKNAAVMYGVNRRSVLDELTYFKVITIKWYI